MVKHQGAQDGVEVCIWERQCFGNCIFQNDLNASSLCLPIGSADHFGRGINASHQPRWSHALFGYNRQTSRATPYVQH
jgi:hypothetical protein